MAPVSLALQDKRFHMDFFAPLGSADVTVDPRGLGFKGKGLLIPAGVSEENDETERDGNSIHLFAPGGREPVYTWSFGRQAREDGLCLADYVLDPVDGRRDHIALFVVTAGEGIRERAAEAKDAGEFFFSHALQALALETAEAASEWLHRRIREDWGFPDPPTLTMHDRFTARYRGKRYSFGYGACPNLEDQQGIWKLLRPEEIGVQLTEGFMMDPEASVSALVFHHPDCVYFTASETAEIVPA